MILSVQLKTGETSKIKMHEVGNKNNTNMEWICDPKGALRIHVDDGGLYRLEKSDEIQSTDDEILEQFITLRAATSIAEAGGIEASEDEVEPIEGPFPYDPETIRVDTKPFNISLVYEMLNDGDINLSPDFQRRFVWTDVGARSRLIESIMLRIPLPVFYMAQDSSGKFHVVDGLQRLTVIKQFLDNTLKLRELEYLKSEEGKTFRDPDDKKCIDQRYRKRILQTQVMFNIIDPQTPSDVKFDIFKRINQGGRPLNAQEIRNCMATAESRKLIGDMSSSREFLAATDGSVGNVRMQDQELVLRFIAFRLSRTKAIPEYSGIMERFLDSTVDFLNLNPSMHKNIYKDFVISMENSSKLFGQYAFRKCLPQDLTPSARRRLINNSLFTSWSVTLADINQSEVKSIKPGLFPLIVAEELQKDPQYFDSVTSGTNDRRRLSYAFSVAERLSRESLK